MSGAEIPLLIAAAGFSAVSSIRKAEGQAAQHKFQAQVNAQQAARERQLAAVEEQRLRRRDSRALAEQRARFGAAGIDPSLGSPLLAQEDAARESEFEGLLVREAGLERARQREIGVIASRARAREASTSGLLAAGGTLLDAGSGVARLL